MLNHLLPNLFEKMSQNDFHSFQPKNRKRNHDFISQENSETRDLSQESANESQENIQFASLLEAPEYYDLTAAEEEEAAEQIISDFTWKKIESTGITNWLQKQDKTIYDLPDAFFAKIDKNGD